MPIDLGAVIAKRWPKEWSFEPKSIEANAEGYISTKDYMERTYALVEQSKLKGFKPPDGPRFGIHNGTTREWTILLAANPQQESSFNTKLVGDKGLFVNKKNPKGGSHGLGQMSPGDGSNSWGRGLTETYEDVYDPDKTTLAIVKAHEYFIRKDGRIASEGKPWRGIARLNGSYRKAHHTIKRIAKAKEWADQFLSRGTA